MRLKDALQKHGDRKQNRFDSGRTDYYNVSRVLSRTSWHGLGSIALVAVLFAGVSVGLPAASTAHTNDYYAQFRTSYDPVVVALDRVGSGCGYAAVTRVEQLPSCGARVVSFRKSVAPTPAVPDSYRTAGERESRREASDRDDHLLRHQFTTLVTIIKKHDIARFKANWGHRLSIEKAITAFSTAWKTLRLISSPASSRGPPLTTRACGQTTMVMGELGIQIAVPRKRVQAMQSIGTASLGDVSLVLVPQRTGRRQRGRLRACGVRRALDVPVGPRGEHLRVRVVGLGARRDLYWGIVNGVSGASRFFSGFG